MRFMVFLLVGAEVDQLLLQKALDYFHADRNYERIIPERNVQGLNPESTFYALGPAYEWAIFQSRDQTFPGGGNEFYNLTDSYLFKPSAGYLSVLFG